MRLNPIQIGGGGGFGWEGWRLKPSLALKLYNFKTIQAMIPISRKVAEIYL